MQLTPRKREILRRVIEEYVATGQPVGSRAVVERSGLSVSSSTVRNELSELEDLSDSDPVWPAVTSTRENCLGAECPEYGRCQSWRRAARRRLRTWSWSTITCCWRILR